MQPLQLLLSQELAQQCREPKFDGSNSELYASVELRDIFSRVVPVSPLSSHHDEWLASGVGTEFGRRRCSIHSAELDREVIDGYRQDTNSLIAFTEGSRSSPTGFHYNAAAIAVLALARE
jgi:hypothetical protein